MSLVQPHTVSRRKLQATSQSSVTPSTVSADVVVHLTDDL
jgi:hypothetical protein